MSNRCNHHLAGRAKQQTRPAAAVFGRPGEFGARSRWVCKLARSSARSTPREGAKHKKPRRPLVGGGPQPPGRLLTARGAGGRWSAATGRTPRESAKRQTRTTRDTPSKAPSHSVHANLLSLGFLPFGSAHLSAAAILCGQFYLAPQFLRTRTFKSKTGVFRETSKTWPKVRVLKN